MKIEELLDEAYKLILTAERALRKIGLADRGSDVSLTHEVRMFSRHFSAERRDGPGDLQVQGNGRADKWKRDVHAFLKQDLVKSGAEEMAGTNPDLRMEILRFITETPQDVTHQRLLALGWTPPGRSVNVELVREFRDYVAEKATNLSHHDQNGIWHRIADAISGQAEIAAPPKVACLWSDQARPHWYFLAELTERKLPEGIPVYRTLDRVVGDTKTTPVITDEVIEKVLLTPVPGGSQVWWCINGGGMKIDHGHRAVVKRVLDAYVALESKP